MHHKRKRGLIKFLRRRGEKAIASLVVLSSPSFLFPKGDQEAPFRRQKHPGNVCDEKPSPFSRSMSLEEELGSDSHGGAEEEGGGEKAKEFGGSHQMPFPPHCTTFSAIGRKVASSSSLSCFYSTFFVGIPQGRKTS